MNETEPKARPNPSKQKQLWRVLVRHTPLIKDHKSFVVEASDKAEAWKEFLKSLEEKVTQQLYHDGTRTHNWYKHAREWILAAKASGPPEGSEIVLDQHFRDRGTVIRIKAVPVIPHELADRFPELAAATLPALS